MKRIMRNLVAGAMIAVMAVFAHAALGSVPVVVAVEADAQFVYLSDITPKSAKVGWGSLGIDKAANGAKISLKVEGAPVSFDKGIFAHATSNLVYDLSEYDFDYFTAYVGINTSSGGAGNGVKFFIYTSNDYQNWDLVDAGLPEVTSPSANASFVKVDIRGKRYLWLKADANGANGNDHSAYGDAKLIKEGYSDDVVRSVADYEAVIREKMRNSGGVMTEEVELLALQRDLVKKSGQYQLKQLFAEGEEYREAFEWVFDDLENLKLFMMGGQPDGNYRAAFEVLAKLRMAHKEDLAAEGETAWGEPVAELYRRMMVALALTHSRAVTFWVSGSPKEAGVANTNISDAVLRYEIYKEMYEEGRLDAVFDQLEVEEMRYVMGAQISDDEIKWARDYAKWKGNSYSGYSFMRYVNVSPTLYRRPAFYAAEGYDITAYESKYKLAGYEVKNVPYLPKLWMVMETGGVCWQISNMGASMTAAQGSPAILIGQPGHSSYLVYTVNAAGKGVWSLWNDVGGWTVANTTAYNGTRGYFTQRLPLGWGNGSYASGSTVTYTMLAQAALDEYDNYVKAEEHVKVAEALDGAEREAEYRKALGAQRVNLDAWVGLITAYGSDESKMQADYYALAEEVAEALKWYPHPMYDMLGLIGKKINEPAYMAAMARLTQENLQIATAATSNETTQWDVTRKMANYFLGKVDTEVAKFAFDGDEARVLKLASKYAGTQAAFDYSLDGGATWSDYVVDGGRGIELTAEEIARINSSDDIKVHIIGVDYSEKNIYTIDITEGQAVSGLYGNDRENRVVGADGSMEWRMEGEAEWSAFGAGAPDLSGDKTVYVRRAATGRALASAEVRFEFSADEVDDEYSYIMVDDLTVAAFSTENVRSNRGEYEYARNAIDGNLYTQWHTDRTLANEGKFITIELADERYVSALEYVPVQNYNYGVIKNGRVLTSRDGEEWAEAAVIAGWEKNNDAKMVKFHTVELVKYVKLEVAENYDYLMKAGANYFVSAAMINLFEDRTKSDLPVMRLEYDVREISNQDVTVKLVNTEPEKVVTIDNNGGSNTYVFHENGEFSFEYSNAWGERGVVTAKVDWIDKVAPVATVEYEKTTAENANGGAVEAMKATVRFSKEGVRLTNEELKPIMEEVIDEENEVVSRVVGYEFADGEVLEWAEDGALVHTFVYNHDFELYFVDAAGNTGSVQVRVDSLTVTDGREEVGSEELDEPDEVEPDEVGGEDEGDSGRHETVEVVSSAAPVRREEMAAEKVGVDEKTEVKEVVVSSEAAEFVADKMSAVEGGEVSDEEDGFDIAPVLVAGGAAVVLGWGLWTLSKRRSPLR